MTMFVAGSALAGPPAGTGASLAGTVDMQTCSGAVVRFKGQSAKSPALVLTNGHCIHVMEADEVIEHAASSRTLTLYDRESAAVARGFHPQEILYATMSGIDLALYRLKESFEELESEWQIPHRFLSDQGIDSLTREPLMLASGHFHKTQMCKPLGVANVREGVWSWPGALSLGECQVIHGMSGSPLISLSTGEIVAVVNTFNAGGARACTQDHPCETASDGAPLAYPGRAYASPVAVLSTCLDATRNFNSQLPGCRLRSHTHP